MKNLFKMSILILLFLSGCSDDHNVIIGEETSNHDIVGIWDCTESITNEHHTYFFNEDYTIVRTSGPDTYDFSGTWDNQENFIILYFVSEGSNDLVPSVWIWSVDMSDDYFSYYFYHGEENTDTTTDGYCNRLY